LELAEFAIVHDRAKEEVLCIIIFDVSS